MRNPSRFPRSANRRRRGPKGKRSGRVDLAKVVWRLVGRHVPDEALRLIRVRDAWDRVAGDRLSAVTWPFIVRKQRLVIHVRDGQWRHELTYLREALLERIREGCPEAAITELDFRLGPVDRSGHTLSAAYDAADESAAVARPPILQADPPPETLSALSSVNDSELRDAMAMARYVLGRPGRQE